MNNYDYPKPQKKEFKEVLHDVEFTDFYQWMEDFDKPEVQEWVIKQNQLTDKLIPYILREKITEEIFPYIDMPTESTREKKGNYLFFYRKIEGKNQKVYIVRNIKSGEEKVLIDPNEWSKDGTIAIDWAYPSPNGKYVVYGKSSGGSEWSILHIINVITEKILHDEIPRTRWANLAWKNDETGFYYTRYPNKGDVPEGEENYHRKLYYHKIGDYYKDDKVIIDKLRKKEEMIGVFPTANKKDYIITRTIDWIMNDLYLLKEDGTIKTICENLDGLFVSDYIDGKIYAYTNYKAPKGKIVKIFLENPSPENWVTIIEESEDIIDSRNVRFIRKSIIVPVLHNAYYKLLIYDLEGKLKREIELPTLGSVLETMGNWEDKEMYFSFTSFFYPLSIYKVNINTGDVELVFEPPLDIDTNKYELKQEWYSSKDGTSVPMFIVKKRDLEMDGNNPTYLTGYGGFNVNLTPKFSHNFPILLNRGVIYAQPNLRGGGEFGKKWHLEGRKEKKQNVFDDFIAAAEWLIENNYTNKNKLIIHGASNGGLLVGAVFTQRPDLYKAAICGVPLLDMLRYHKFYVANIWSDEYGSADNHTDFEYLLKYSPYHNIKEKTKYPAILFTTAESDTRVHPMHALKMTAKLQEIEKSNPILLKYEFKAGHGLGKPLKKIAEIYAYILGFTLWQLGLE